MQTYQTVSQIDAYALTKLHTGGWDTSSHELKLKASYEATRLIDLLNAKGEKLDVAQELEWPRKIRGITSEISYTDILKAHSELSLELLESDNVTARNGNVISERFAAVGITYDANNVSVWLRAGIPSELAWAYLVKYLIVPGSIRLRRVS